jgi:hypothetical protein
VESRSAVARDRVRALIASVGVSAAALILGTGSGCCSPPGEPPPPFHSKAVKEVLFEVAYEEGAAPVF